MASVKIDRDFIQAVKQRLAYIHDRCIQKSGGTPGVLSNGNLEFVVYDILRFSDKHKGDSLSVAAYAYFVIATRHCFVDGNKRTSYLFAKELLLNMDIHLKLQYPDACPFILKIASGEKTLKEIRHWLQQHTDKFKQKDKEKYLKDFLRDIEHAEEKEGTKNG